MDFLSEQQIFYTSKRYEPIYSHFNKEFEVKYHELFVLCATIGFRYNSPEDTGEKGREFRSNYLDSKQKSTIYTIILSDTELGKQLESFSDKDYILRCRKKIEQYAEGGMSILCKELFGNKWKPPLLDTSYLNYDIDVIKFVIEKSLIVPF